MFRQIFEFSGIDITDHIRTGGKDLSEFDKCRTQFLQHVPEPGRAVKCGNILCFFSFPVVFAVTVFRKIDSNKLPEAAGSYDFQNIPEPAQRPEVPVQMKAFCYQIFHFFNCSPIKFCTGDNIMPYTVVFNVRNVCFSLFAALFGVYLPDF